MLRNFVDVVGIAGTNDFPVIGPANRYAQFTAEETVTLQASKPDIEQINSVMVEARVSDYRTITTPVGLKVIVNGILVQKITYTASDPVQSVHSAHFEEPFCNFIDIPLVIPTGQNVMDVLQSLNITLEDVVVGGPYILVEDLSVAQVDARNIKKCSVLFTWVEVNALLLPVLKPV